MVMEYYSNDKIISTISNSSNRDLPKDIKEHILTLQYMLSVLMVRQSAWYLDEDERKKTKQGIDALQASIQALCTQIHA